MIVTVMLTSVVYAATEEEEQAEIVRIYEDMQKFKKRGNWEAVERKYLEMLKYKKANPKHEMHILGAQASSEKGDIGTTYERLELALAIEEVSETRTWIDSITSSYLRVDITVSNDYTKIPDLTPAAMPFFPDQQQAIAFAQQQLQSTGKFKGMLPLGEYMMGTTTFNLQKDMSGVQKIKVAETIALGGLMPRIDLGVSGANAGVSSGEQEALPFNGYGTRIGAGVSMQVGSQYGVIAQLGYHSAFNGGQEPSSFDKQNYGAEVTPTQYHAGYVWLGGSMDFSSVEVSIGPIFEYAKVRTQGLDGYNFAPAVGTVLAGGISAGLTYYNLKLGPLDGGISTQFGTQTDTSRLYSWGQVAFTINGGKR